MTGLSHHSFAVLPFALVACASAPSPLVPAWHGSIGTSSHGVLAEGAELKRDPEALHWLRSNDRHWGLPRFTEAIARAAREVARARPGAALYTGDLSARQGGGPLPPHFSHRSGLDADLLFYVTTLEGAPVDSPGFVHFGPDGIARDDGHQRWLRFDVEREWLLVKALVEDPQARVQWIFINDIMHTMLIEWALARGDPAETILRAEEVMREPHPGGAHDDHIHVRTACSPEETVAGCEPTGPRRAWLRYDLARREESDEELALALAQPLETTVASAETKSDAPGQATARSQGKSMP